MAASLALVKLVAFLAVPWYNFLPGQTSTPQRTTRALEERKQSWNHGSF